MPGARLARATGAARSAALLAVTFVAAACAAVNSSVPAAAPADLPVQSQAPATVLHDNPDWRERYDEARIEPDVIEALASAPSGAHVVVLYGVWCPDSRWSIPVLWKALDEARQRFGDNGLPFRVEHVDVDEDKTSAIYDVSQYDLRYVPTIIVMREGEEVGRIVETAPHDIMTDFVDLLYGSASGVLTTREDL